MAPVIFGVDMYGYDIKKYLPEKWIDRTERSYEYILSNLSPKWYAPKGLGYGQNYFTQTALLLDRMQDAESLLNVLARFCFAPRHENPFRVPEGATTNGDGNVWRRWGDLGNLMQMNGTVYTLLIIPGVDDTNANCLKLMPRMPYNWSSVAIQDYPVMTFASGQKKLVHINMTNRTAKETNTLSMDLTSTEPIDNLKIRLGPIPKNTISTIVKVNGKIFKDSVIESGDSKWSWIEIPHNKQKQLILNLNYQIRE
jgi:hypothetical protein